MPVNGEYNAQASARLLRAVEDLIVSGNNSTASRILEVYLEEFPDDPKVLRSLGRLRTIQDRPEEAAELLERSIELLTESGEQADIPDQMKQTVFSSDASRCVDDDIVPDDIDYSNSVASDAEANRKYYAYPDQQSASAGETGGNYQGARTPLCEGSSGIGERGNMEPMNRVDEFDRPLQEKISEETVAPVRTHEPVRETEQSLQRLETEEMKEIPFPAGESMVDVAGEEETADEDKDLDFLLDTRAKKPTVSCEEFDCQILDEHLEELDEEPTPREFDDEISVGGKVTREDRALQEAIILGQEFGWDNEGVMILAEVFTAYWWNSAKRSMRRELEAGLHPAELQLAIIARRAWAQNKKYGLNIRGYPYQAMSWSAAMEFVRSFRSYPDAEEIVFILDEMFVEWYARASLQREYSSFHEYFINRLKFPCGDYLATPAIFIGDGQEYLEDDFDGGAFLGYNTPLNRALEDYGLLRDIWVNEPIYRDDGDRYVEDSEVST